jgi:hypothetical protein
VRLLGLSERHAPVVLALLGAPAAAAGAAPGRVPARCFHLFAAVAAPLGQSWLRGRAGASPRLLAVLRTANSGSVASAGLDEAAPFRLVAGPASSCRTSTTASCRASGRTSSRSSTSGASISATSLSLRRADGGYRRPAMTTAASRSGSADIAASTRSRCRTARPLSEITTTLALRTSNDSWVCWDS